MIQVIERTFKLLEELALDGEVSLETLSRSAKLNKGTLCNILKTLINLGYVERCSRGSYRLTANFHNLCTPVSWSEDVLAVMRRTTAKLAAELRESIVISTLRNNRVAIISQSQFQRNLMINEVICYANLSLYHSVSGRIVLSFLDPGEQKQLFEANPVPADEWDNITTFEELTEAAAVIRQRELSVMTNEAEGIKSFAVPVFDNAGNICASLALTMPISRLAPDGGTGLVTTLRRNAAALTGQLTAFELSAEKIIQL